MKILCLGVTSFFLLPLSFLAAGEIVVDTNFSGGSAAVESIDQKLDVIKLTPTPYSDKGFVCWWYAKVSGLTSGETLTLDVGNAPWATPDQAVFSIDNTNWKQTRPGRREGKRIRYEIEVNAPDIWVAWGPPFLLKHAQEAIKKAARKSFADEFELCQTRGGHPTPAISITEAKDTEQRLGIWIQARQHAWESGSSWVCQGLLEWIVSDDPQAKRLRQKALMTVVPIMDIDNVQLGAGGKNQKPQDHNRDWSAEPHWKAVSAAQTMIRDQDQQGRFDLFVDLHNPGANDKNPYFYIPPRDQLEPIGRENLNTFLEHAQQGMTGPLAFKGRAVESGPKYDSKAWQFISKNWVAMNTNPHVVAVTLETAWNTPASTQDNYKQTGRELGKAIASYFEKNRRIEN